MQGARGRMRLAQCLKCGKMDWIDSHRCEPQWEVAFDVYDGDWEKVRAPTAAEAAARYVEKYDQAMAEFTEHCNVYVRLADERVQLFDVTGTLCPAYTAVEHV